MIPRLLKQLRIGIQTSASSSISRIEQLLLSIFTSVKLNSSTTQALRVNVDARRNAPSICVISETHIESPIPSPTVLLVVNGFNSEGVRPQASQGRYRQSHAQPSALDLPAHGDLRGVRAGVEALDSTFTST